MMMTSFKLSYKIKLNGHFFFFFFYFKWCQTKIYDVYNQATKSYTELFDLLTTWIKWITLADLWQKNDTKQLEVCQNQLQMTSVFSYNGQKLPIEFRSEIIFLVLVCAFSMSVWSLIAITKHSHRHNHTSCPPANISQSARQIFALPPDSTEFGPLFAFGINCLIVKYCFDDLYKWKLFGLKGLATKDMDLVNNNKKSLTLLRPIHCFVAM